jgi:outer membrane biosynthesis protein TonB
MTAFYLIGAALTAVLYPVLFAKRYGGRGTWVVVGVVLGLVAALLWPVALWVAVALWLTGFTRPSTGQRWRRRVAFPLATAGSLVTLVVMGVIIGPAPPPAPPAAVADVIPTTSAVPATTAAPTTTPPPTSAVPVLATTNPPVTTQRQVVTATTPAPEPAPQPKPKPQPKPRPAPEPEPDRDDSGTKPRSGDSGHPCLPGERDGDDDGYCGEG